MDEPADPKPADIVEELLIECLDRAEAEGPQAIEDVCRRHPEHAGALRRELGILEGLGLFDSDRGAAPDATVSAGAPGEPVVRQIGEFRIRRKLGEGGMGVVYLAEQTSLRRLVALKVLRAGPAAGPGLAARFEREALTVARLRHPGIVTLFGAGEADGVRWLAMELVPGRGLDEVYAEAARAGARVPVPDVVRFGRDLARALACAHAAGVVHRDVKPSNVRITPDGRAMLLDFGLARDLEQPGLTRTGEFQGSPHYASPEQVARGRDPVGPASDVYSLGVTLYEGAAGAMPFAGETVEQLFQEILAREPVPPRRANPAVPRDVETVLLRAMEKDPARRYASAAALAEDLDAILALRPIAARRPGPLLRLAKWARGHRPAAAAAGTAAAAMFVFAVLALVRADSEREAARRDARAALDAAKGRLESFRRNRAELAAAEARVALQLRNLDYNWYDPADDERLDREEAAVERGRREREMAVVQVLALLQRAEELDPGNDEPRRLRAALYAEKAEEARNALDSGMASFYRDLVFATDPGGPEARRAAGRVDVSFATEPAGAEVHLFRYRVLSELVDGAEPRLVPVPVGDAVPAVAPGTWCLRVVRGAGELQPGDLIVEVAGHPVRGTMFERPRGGDDAAPDPLFDDGGKPVRDAWEAERLGLRGFTPAQLAERGGVRARTFRNGALLDEVLPAGLGVRVTAAPRVRTPASRVGATPAGPVALEPGSYLAWFRGEGRDDVLLPFKVAPGPSARHEVVLHPAGTAPEGFVHVPRVPGGWAEEEFWLHEREVTAAEWLEFLDDAGTRRAIDVAAPDRILVPREGQGTHWERGPDGRYALGNGWKPEWPVFGVSWPDAEAYARWRTERARAAGVPFTFALPTFGEWKTAGHGGDGRDYVFGWKFRPKWMSSNYARPKPGPEPVLRFPVDESVFGVFDMSGSVLEWLDDWYRDGELRRAAGGGWGQADSHSYFLVEGGLGLAPDSVANLVGLRLVARLSR